MKTIIALALLVLISLAGCGGSGLNGNWIGQWQGTTLTLEGRSDGTVVFNGSNFGAKWSGNHAILIPYDTQQQAGFLVMMVDAVLNENGRVVDQEEMKSLNNAANPPAIRGGKKAPADAPSMSPDDAKKKLKKLAFRIPVRWVDSDHIDLGGAGPYKEQFPAFGFTRTK
ncbi:MAG: hypothetical protein ABR915_08815 [Thermoguttaceae bacterium]|jgi:hypothetical protein